MLGCLQALNITWDVILLEVGVLLFLHLYIHYFILGGKNSLMMYNIGF